MVDSPSREVRELMDRVEIRELTARYNRCFDDQDAAGWAEVFTDDGTLEVLGGQTVEGRDALRAMCEATGYGTVHTTTDAVIEIDGDAATQVCTLVLAHRTREPKTSTFGLTGRYEDELVRTPAGWRFRRRTITLDGER